MKYTADVDANYKTKIDKRKQAREKFRIMFSHLIHFDTYSQSDNEDLF